MVQLLRIIAILASILCIINGAFVRSVPSTYCGYTKGYTDYTSTCPSNNVQIELPFWIPDSFSSSECVRYPGFQITCESNGRQVFNISNNPYYVLDIQSDFLNGSLRVVDVAMKAQECPRPQHNISLESAKFLKVSVAQNINMTIFYNCSRHPENLVQHVPCLDNNTTTGIQSFAFYDNKEIMDSGFNWFENCELTVVVPVTRKHSSGDHLRNISYTQALKNGFSIDWEQPTGCPSQECRKGLEYENKLGTIGLIGIIGIIGVLLLLLFFLVLCIRCCYSQLSRWRKRIKGLTNVEVFLENNYRDLSLQSYKYSDIKKMTNSFKDMLGHGGFGSVYKGKLPNGQLVAVKVLNESKGKGDDFVNEVGTIGRTNHVNVVSLLGLCTGKKKRALVYEFMLNGSLEKFIHAANDSSTTSSFLGWEKFYEIALGIARGLEYLHRGCNTRILHLDIKPHNILLDQDFCPKISDFGLAKLCPARESNVFLDGGLGTPGYTAPEVCSGDLRGVSHKSDVFSYGMMIFEMIGGRKNIDLNVNTSKIYFPQWVYKHLQENNNAEVLENKKVDAPGEIFEEETTKKMAIVALWCTQVHPEARPSMNEVVIMLEGNIEDLHFPPNPFPNISSTSSLP